MATCTALYYTLNLHSYLNSKASYNLTGYLCQFGSGWTYSLYYRRWV